MTTSRYYPELEAKPLDELTEDEKFVLTAEMELRRLVREMDTARDYALAELTENIRPSSFAVDRMIAYTAAATVYSELLAAFIYAERESLPADTLAAEIRKSTLRSLTWSTSSDHIHTRRVQLADALGLLGR